MGAPGAYGRGRIPSDRAPGWHLVAQACPGGLPVSLAQGAALDGALRDVARPGRGRGALCLASLPRSLLGPGSILHPGPGRLAHGPAALALALAADRLLLLLCQRRRLGRRLSLPVPHAIGPLHESKMTESSTSTGSEAAGARRPGPG